MKISPFVYFVLATLVLCGCGDDNDSNVTSYDFDVSSSSEITESSESQSSSSSLKKTSSSSQKKSSSSAVKLSSSSVKSSSSLSASSSSNLSSSVSSSRLSSSSSSSVLILSSSSFVSSSSVNSTYSHLYSMLALLSSSSSVNSSSSVAKSSSDAYKYDYIEDSRDGKKYKVLKFGKRRWMVENLAFDYQYPGVETRNAKEPDSVEFYGRTYLWSETMDSSAVFSTTGKNCGYGKPKCRPCGARGICPSGWHVPSLAEWFELFENDDEDKLNLFAVYRND